MNGYRPIVELMNTNFGIYGIAEMSSAGNTSPGETEQNTAKRLEGAFVRTVLVG